MNVNELSAVLSMLHSDRNISGGIEGNSWEKTFANSHKTTKFVKVLYICCTCSTHDVP